MLWFRSINYLILCYFLLHVFACGYKWTASTPISLPKGITKLYLEKVENPTTQTWLEPRLRTAFREEFTRRGQIQWVKETETQGLVQIDITHFSSTTKLEDAQERTVKSEVTLGLEVKIFSQSEHVLLWNSDPVVVRESYTGSEEGPQRRKAEYRVVDLAVEEVANKLGQKF